MANAAPAPAIRVCQPGWDVRNCPDWAYLFNSDWPSLAIAFETTIPNPGAGTTINHNLGYPPLVMVWNNVSGTLSYGRQAAGFTVTPTTVVVSGVSQATTLTVVCFNVDISKEQLYPLPQSAQQKLPYNQQFGMKVVKPNGNRLIYSNNLNDFVIHTRAQSPAVLAVATQRGQFFTNSNPGSTLTGPWLVFPLKTSYIPWAYTATSSGSNTYTFTTVNSLQVINNQLVYSMNGSTIGSLIVLRDPLFYPNTVKVTF